MPNEAPLIINGSLQAVDMKSLLLQNSQQFARSIQPKLHQSLPLLADGRLRVGELYPSTLPSEKTIRYYLPDYELRVVNGKFQTSLKLRAADDDPNAPLGVLTIDLTATAPHQRGFKLREIRHAPTLHLGYQIPTEEGDDDQRGRVPSSGQTQADFVGKWVNVDPDTRGMTRLNIAPHANPQAVMLQAFGKCHPTDCEWGETIGRLNNGAVTAIYRWSFARKRIDLRRDGGQLHVRVRTHFIDDSGRDDQDHTYVMKLVRRVRNRPIIWRNLGALERVSTSVRRCTVPIHSQAEYDTLLRIMTDAVHQARLEVRMSATVGQRTWQQVFIGNARREIIKKTDLKLIELDPKLIKQIRKPIQPEPVNPIILPHIPPTILPSTIQPHIASPTRGTIQPHITPIRLEGVRLHEHAIARRKPLGEVATIAETNILLANPIIPPKERIISKDLIVDKKGNPVIVERKVQAVDVISPFWFDLTEVDFDAPDDITTKLTFLKHDVIVDDERAIFYQHSLVREQFYYEPQAFRLARNSQHPHLPSLLFAFNEVVENADDGTIDFQVRCSYNLQPSIAPRFVLHARQQFGTEARFSVLLPTITEFVVDVAGSADPQNRDTALVSFTNGILDELALSDGEFAELVSGLTAGSGITGEVRGVAEDGQPLEIAVDLSLHENVGVLFTDSFQPTATPDRYAVTLTNQIESPVKIEALPAAVLSATAQAIPITPVPVDPIPPNGSIIIEYQVTPAGFNVLALDPPVEATILPDMETLLPALMINEGYTSDTFEITVSIDALFFELANPPLDGIVVEFGDDSETMLTADERSQTVTLRMPLLARLLQSADAQTYQYRITNQHTDGTETVGEWTTSQGDLAALPVGVM